MKIKEAAPQKRPPSWRATTLYKMNKTVKLSLFLISLVLCLVNCASYKTIKTSDDLSDFNLNMEFVKADIATSNGRLYFADIHADSFIVQGINLHTNPPVAELVSVFSGELSYFK